MITTALIGAIKVSQFEENLAALENPLLGRGELSEIEQILAE